MASMLVRRCRCREAGTMLCFVFILATLLLMYQLSILGGGSGLCIQSSCVTTDNALDRRQEASIGGTPVQDECVAPGFRQHLVDDAGVLYTSIQWLHTCLSTIPLRHDVQEYTVAALRSGLTIAKERKHLFPATSDYSTGTDDNDDNVQDEPRGSPLSSLEGTFQDILEFHQAIQQIVAKLKDPHVKYRPPFALVTSLCLPLEFGSRLLGNASSGFRQEVFISRLTSLEGLDLDAHTVASYRALVGSGVQAVNGLGPFAFLGLLAGAMHGVSSVGMALNYMTHRSCFDLSIIPLPPGDRLILTVNNQRIHLPLFIRVPVIQSPALRCLLGDNVTARFAEPGRVAGTACPSSAALCSISTSETIERGYNAVPRAHRISNTAVALSLPSFLVEKTEMLSAVYASLLKFRHHAFRPTSLVLDVGGNTGGYALTMLSVLRFLVWVLPVETTPLDGSTYTCPLYAFSTTPTRLIRARLLKLLQLFPSKLACLQCVGPVLMALENYARMAGLPDAILKEILDRKMSLLRRMWVSEPTKSSQMLRALLLKVLTAQSRYFLACTGLEERHCVRDMDHVLHNTSQALAMKRFNHLLHAHSNDTCVTALRPCENIFNGHSADVTQIPEADKLSMRTMLANVTEIAIVSDGWCASSCAQFTYMLRQLHASIQGFPKVKLVTFGGVFGAPMPVASAGDAVAYDYSRYAEVVDAIQNIIQVLERRNWWRNDSHPFVPATAQTLSLCPAKFTYSSATVMPPLGIISTLQGSKDVTRELEVIPEPDHHLSVWPDLRQDGTSHTDEARHVLYWSTLAIIT